MFDCQCRWPAIFVVTDRVSRRFPFVGMGQYVAIAGFCKHGIEAAESKFPDNINSQFFLGRRQKKRQSLSVAVPKVLASEGKKMSVGKFFEPFADRQRYNELANIMKIQLRLTMIPVCVHAYFEF